MNIPKVRVILESFHYDFLKAACYKVKATLEKISNKNEPVGIITLPTQKRIYCVLKSPHVNKSSREHFEIRRHKRMLEIYSTDENNATISDLLSEININAAIYYKVKIRGI